MHNGGPLNQDIWVSRFMYYLMLMNCFFVISISILIKQSPALKTIANPANLVILEPADPDIFIRLDTKPEAD